MQPFLPMVDDHHGGDAVHPEQSPPTRGLDSNQAIVNPLVSASPTYSFNRAGWLCIPHPNLCPSSAVYTDNTAKVYHGSASSWSFSHQILRMAHDRVSTDPMPVDDLLFEGRTYDLGWRGERMPPERTALPTPDFAAHLINTVKFRCGQLFHLFDERTFMQSLADFRADPQLADRSQGVWFPHYLLVLAIGQALNSQTNSGRRPPGAALFAWAMSLLPDPAFCAYTEPMEAIEALCCAALYLHCLDFRIAAYTYVRSDFPVERPITQGEKADIGFSDRPSHASRPLRGFAHRLACDTSRARRYPAMPTYLVDRVSAGLPHVVCYGRAPDDALSERRCSIARSDRARPGGGVAGVGFAH